MQTDGRNERNHCQSAKTEKVNAEKNKTLKVTPQWSDTTMLAWNNELIKGTSLHYITSRSANASTSSTSMYTHRKVWQSVVSHKSCYPALLLLLLFINIAG